MVFYGDSGGLGEAMGAVANPDKLRHLGPVSRTWHLRSSDTRAESETGVDDGDARAPTASSLLDGGQWPCGVTHAGSAAS